VFPKKDNMNYKQLGKSALQVSEIGFGCMSLKGSQQENERIIDKATELGINYFDTADLYDKGMNETSIGKALKNKRDRVILATKVGNEWKADGSGWDWNPTKVYILSAVEGSLKRLQTDYIDLYQLHGGTIEDPIDETIEAFETLKQQGKIRYYGISSIRPNVIREYVRRSNIVSVMMQYSLLDRRPEETCFPLLKENNVGVLARGTIAQGLLINKLEKAYLNYREEEVKQAAKAVASLSFDVRSAAETALQFALQNPAVTSAVAGIRTLEQLEDAVKTESSPPLTQDEMETLHQSVKVNSYNEHR
jgi:aryl-alcohol dehydrogenase-like predicted oxidoreductase